MFDHEAIVAGARPCHFCGNKDITVLKTEFFDENGMLVLYFKCENCGYWNLGGVYEKITRERLRALLRDGTGGQNESRRLQRDAP